MKSHPRQAHDSKANGARQPARPRRRATLSASTNTDRVQDVTIEGNTFRFIISISGIVQTSNRRAPAPWNSRYVVHFTTGNRDMHMRCNPCGDTPGYQNTLPWSMGSTRGCLNMKTSDTITRQPSKISGLWTSTGFHMHFRNNQTVPPVHTQIRSIQAGALLGGKRDASSA